MTKILILHGHIAAAALLATLKDVQVEFGEALPITKRDEPPLPSLWLKDEPTPTTYGPPKRGRKGKVRRW